jgi:hypothetical protein
VNPLIALTVAPEFFEGHDDVEQFILMKLIINKGSCTLPVRGLEATMGTSAGKVRRAITNLLQQGKIQRLHTINTRPTREGDTYVLMGYEDMLRGYTPPAQHLHAPYTVNSTRNPQPAEKLNPIIEPTGEAMYYEAINKVYQGCMSLNGWTLGKTDDEVKATRQDVRMAILAALRDGKHQPSELIAAATEYVRNVTEYRKGMWKFFGTGEYANWLPKPERQVPEQVREMLKLKNKGVA